MVISIWSATSIIIFPVIWFYTVRVRRLTAVRKSQMPAPNWPGRRTAPPSTAMFICEPRKLSDNIASAYCQFEYYHPSLGWTVIGNDYEPDVTLRNTISAVSYSEGYSAIWNAPPGCRRAGIHCAQPFTRSSAYTTVDSLNVYVDNTPLCNRNSANPVWGTSACDTATFAISLSDEDVTYLQFMYRLAEDTLAINPPMLLQRPLRGC